MMTCWTSQTVVNNSNYGLYPTPSYDVTMCSSDISSYERFVTVLQTTIVALISIAIILSNIINLIVLVSASAAMPWATRLFLVNLSSSDLLVGVIACAPAVLPAATDRWTYGDYLARYLIGPTGGLTVTLGVKYPELLMERRVLFQYGAYQWSDCTGSNQQVFLQLY